MRNKWQIPSISFKDLYCIVGLMLINHPVKNFHLWHSSAHFVTKAGNVCTQTLVYAGDQ